MLQKTNFEEKNKKTQNLAKHIEDLINYETLMKIAFRGGGGGLLFAVIWVPIYDSQNSKNWEYLNENKDKE